MAGGTFFFFFFLCPVRLSSFSCRSPGGGEKRVRCCCAGVLPCAGQRHTRRWRAMVSPTRRWRCTERNTYRVERRHQQGMALGGVSHHARNKLPLLPARGAVYCVILVFGAGGCLPFCPVPFSARVVENLFLAARERGPFSFSKKGYELHYGTLGSRFVFFLDIREGIAEAGLASRILVRPGQSILGVKR